MKIYLLGPKERGDGWFWVVLVFVFFFFNRALCFCAGWPQTTILLPQPPKLLGLHLAPSLNRD